jgi:HSP20 family molecular chaperone IbpA
MKVRVQAVESVGTEVEAIQRRITERAAQLASERQGEGSQLDDWLRAERETVFRPLMEVVRGEGAFIVEATVPGVNPKRLRVKVTPDELLVYSDAQLGEGQQSGDVVLCEFVSGPLFRTYHFPQRVDGSGATAECVNGLLRVTVPIDREGPWAPALAA